AISRVSIHRIRFLLMPACRRLLINLGSFRCLARTHTWRSEAPNTCATLFTTQLNMSAFGIQPSRPTWLKNGQKASITTSHFPTPP
ncbi:hypothetical protein GOGPGP_GOGPGP_13630, partial [Dysosmobacter welbionis]